MRDFWGFGGICRGDRNRAILFLVLAVTVAGSIGCSGFVQGTSSGGGGGTPLSISNVASSSVTDTSAAISWQTNISANSQVEYGTTTSYGSTTVLDQVAVTNHKETVSGLKPATLYHFRVHSGGANNASAVSGDSTFTSALDKTPPTVSVTSPAANATLSGTVTLTATASDDVAVASVQFKVDNASTGTPITSAPYTYSLNTTTLADGAHVLTAVATDTSGNTTTSSGVTVTVNNTTPAPSISGVNPASGLVGASVTISGANFGATQGTSTVKFNGTAATPTSWSATSIVAPVPAGATTGNIVVTVGGVASNGVSFTVTTPAPSISGVNPASGLVGTSVTISGANFGATQGTSTVKFNGTAATPASWNAASIVAVVPAGATTGNVVVTVGGVASNGVSFTVTSPANPTISSLNPTSGLVGTSVTISGANFGATQGTSTVKFNGTAATPTSWNATSIVAPVPAGAITGNVVVTVGGVASNGVSFTVTVPAPSISSLNPTSGLVGTSVTITGSNFGASQGSSTVKFNGISASPTSWSAASIVAPVPTGATTGNVVVTVGGVASNGVSFTVTTPAPNISSVNPASGIVGSSVTISGSNFGATQGTSTVTFAGIAATPTSWSATSIVAPVPTSAITGNVVVTVGGVASNGVSFTVTASGPSISSLNPNSGTVGTSVTISGANFGSSQGASTVTFNGTSATPTSWTATSIVAPVPAGATSGNVVVTVGGVASNGVNFTVSTGSGGIPTLIYSLGAPLAIPSGSSWNGPGSCNTAQNCYRVPLPELTTAGATLTMAFAYNTGSGQVFSVTDDKSNTWTLDTTSPASNGKALNMYHASNVAAGTSYVNIQITGGTNNDYWQPLVAEFFNVGALDGSSCSTGNSTTISAGSITPAQSGDLIFQAKVSANSLSGSSPYGLPLQTASFTPGLQPNITWSLASQQLGDGAADQYGVYNSTVPLNPTFTQTASDNYISCAVALRAASAGVAATAIPRVVHLENDAMPKNAANPWHVGFVVDVPKSAVYLSYVGNDSITSVSSIPAPNVGWTPSGADFNGTNGHNHVNFYCAQWTTPPGEVTLSINRSASSNDSINMIYVVQNGTCNLDVDSGGQAGFKNDGSPLLTTCAGCLTPTKANDFIMANGGEAYCTVVGLSSPAGGISDTVWYTGNTIDGPTQTDENNYWMHFYNGSSLSPITVSWTEACNNPTQNWASRIAAYQSQ